MIDRIKGRIAFICDECQDGLETDDYELDDAMKLAKQNGWRNIPIERLPKTIKLKLGVKYANLCSNCAEHIEV